MLKRFSKFIDTVRLVLAYYSFISNVFYVFKETRFFIALGKFYIFGHARRIGIVGLAKRK